MCIYVKRVECASSYRCVGTRRLRPLIPHGSRLRPLISNQLTFRRPLSSQHTRKKVDRSARSVRRRGTAAYSVAHDLCAIHLPDLLQTDLLVVAFVFDLILRPLGISVFARDAQQQHHLQCDLHFAFSRRLDAQLPRGKLSTLRARASCTTQPSQLAE